MTNIRITYYKYVKFSTHFQLLVKTPGGKVVYIYVKKRGTFPKCGDCKSKLFGIKPSRPRERTSMSKRLKTVNRPYGGLMFILVIDRIIRAFMMEEQKVLKQLIKEQKRREKKATAEHKK
ncbi:unnamed protein product [Schistosoma curassoni]|uniref:Large ribosomal subunit protein eL34 n=1 Tax=Schistosoma curassoni TaxID=6186 RepID=A0A3P8A3G6_9TREM|nr:unnamed protein product [Schistosoma curassoni]